jgi:choline-sulfatase
VPNIVMLMADEHNPLYASVYGHPYVKTPNMERLARMGTVFQNAYCNSPLCTPSRSAFLSGKPVHQIQVYNNCNVVSFEYPSYGQRLREQGVHTVHIGRTDAWNHSGTLGFSEMLLPIDKEAPGDTNFRRAPLSIRRDGSKRANGYGPREHAFDTDIMNVERGIEWLTRSAPGLRQPWTLAVNIGAPHFPHYVTQELWDLYPEGGDLPEFGVDRETAQHPYAQDIRDHFQLEAFSEEQIRGLRRGYLGCVTFVDEQLGKLLDTLESNGQLEDTVVVYTADHGEMLGKFGMWWKCSLYEDSVRIPLIAAGPGFKQGARCEAPVTLFDLQASICKAVNKSRPDEWWGRDLGS